MPESRDLVELKREVVEARNQAIKTDNQITNLGLDVKSFERRFDLLERRTRLASLGANVVVAVVIMTAAYLVHSVRTGGLRSQLEEARVAAEQAQSHAGQRTAQLERRVAAAEETAKQRDKVEVAAATFLAHLDAGREKQAEAVLDDIDMAAAGPAVQKIAGARIAAYRRDNAEAAYKAGRSHANAGRSQNAVAELRRSLRLQPQGRYATQAAYLVATSLWSQKKYAEAVTVLRDMQKRDIERGVANEVQFLLGAALARSGEREESLSILESVAASGNKYAGTSQSYVAALRAGAELPPVPGSRSRSHASPAAGSTAGTPPPRLTEPLAPR
jgi:TolA-binding protein